MLALLVAAERAFDLVAAPGPSPAALDPRGHALEDRPCVLAQEVEVAGGVHVARERERDREAHVLLEEHHRRVRPDPLLAMERCARPWELQAAIAVHRGIPLG